MDKELLKALEDYRQALADIITDLADSHYLAGKHHQAVKTFLYANRRLNDALLKAQNAQPAPPTPANPPTA